MEIWKTIPNFSRYEASNKGNLRSLNYKNTGTIKVLKPSLTGGYYKTMLQNDQSKYRSLNVHFFIALAFLGERPKNLEVNHKNGIKTDNTIDNLEYCTNSQNVLHAFKNNLSVRRVGSLNGMSKLTEKDVLEIRDHAANNGRNYGRKMLSEKYNVSECTIKEVVNRRRNKFYNV